MKFSFSKYTFLLFSLTSFLYAGALAQSLPGENERSATGLFFSPDSLKGFDFVSTRSEAEEEHLNSVELNYFLLNRQRDFIRKKYHLQVSAIQVVEALPALSTPIAGCNNADFETGSYTGWTGSTGYNANSSNPLTLTSSSLSTLGTNSSEQSCSFHTLVTSAAGLDPFGHFPMLDPAGGRYAVRLGGENINLNGIGVSGLCPYGGPALECAGEVLQSSFGVTPSNALFTYKYAVVLDDGGHPVGEQPYFKVEVLDSKGKQIPCLQYYQQCVAGQIPKGYKKSNVKSSYYQDSVIYYLPWTTNSIDLTSYIGSTVTVKFTAAGCTLGAHFGYAYVDCSCSFFSLGTSASCTTHTISAPPGAQSYQWNTIPPGQPGLVPPTNAQTVTFNMNGTFAATITTGTGCSYTVDTTVACPNIPTPPTPLPAPDCGELKIYSALSPNGDGHNDAWLIDCIETYPDNEVTILNQWGQVVWETTAYDNHSKCWKGTNQSGQALPDGTYYYLVKLSWKKYKGRVELIR